QALLANARIDLERYRTLYAQDSIAKQQVDTQEALVRQYEGTVKADQGQVDNVRLQLPYAPITAPVGGRLSLRLVDPGNLVRGGQGTFVYVIKEDRTVALRKVAVGMAEGDSVSIESGLAPGERVVVEGSDRLRDGAKVEIADRAASAAPGEGKARAPGKGEGKRRRKEGV